MTRRRLVDITSVLAIVRNTVMLRISACALVNFLSFGVGAYSRGCLHNCFAVKSNSQVDNTENAETLSHTNIIITFYRTDNNGRTILSIAHIYMRFIFFIWTCVIQFRIIARFRGLKGWRLSERLALIQGVNAYSRGRLCDSHVSRVGTYSRGRLFEGVLNRSITVNGITMKCRAHAWSHPRIYKHPKFWNSTMMM